MKFDEMSDFEINRKLTQIVKGYSDSFMHRNSDFYLDYCNSWADMWPLIAEHGLTNVRMNGYWVCHSLSKFGDDEEHNSESDNPLRAAAICLIKKLEAEND